MHKLALQVSLGVLLLDSVIFAGEPICARPETPEANNFVIRTYGNGPSSGEVRARCERLRTELQRSWLGAEAGTAWWPRCEIVLHATRAGYLQAVGRGGGSTSGSSLVRLENSRIVQRRIDLLVDQQGGLPALAHELTHVVLADRFGGQPPRWIDEGVATAADSLEKQTLHYRDCQHALRSGTALRIVEVLTLEQFTSAEQVPAFYGQSLSLVHFLAAQDEPGRIIDFAEKAGEHGYDQALKDCYGIDGIADLELKWRNFATTAGQKPVQPSIVTVSHQP